eukprot:2551314-Amphidinium_carterae.1
MPMHGHSVRTREFPNLEQLSEGSDWTTFGNTPKFANPFCASKSPHVCAQVACVPVYNPPCCDLMQSSTLPRSLGVHADSQKTFHLRRRPQLHNVLILSSDPISSSTFVQPYCP